jgi:DtxR family Mn-dependent transcriptional regulator
MTNPRGERSPVSDSVGDYLKAIWILGGGQPVSTSDIAGHLQVSAPSVSGMLARLHEAGLVSHERYHGAALTDRGTREALRLVRRHRLIETFLVHHLDYDWDEVHEEAEILEHAVSDRFVERLDDMLEGPTHDPHGDPIPAVDGAFPETPDRRLVDTGAGTRFRISRLVTQDRKNLADLAAFGLRPGTEVMVVKEASGTKEGDTLRLQVDGGEVSLSVGLASLIEGEVV